MLNKKLVLGSLAGATLLVGAVVMLPSSASALGLMSGQCVNCHTMHDSVGGTQQGVVGAQAQLLKWNGCVGCHTIGANTAVVLGHPGNVLNADPYAPQVGSAASATQNGGGYFNVATDSHAVNDLGLAMEAYNGNVAPGGSFPTGVTTSFDCVDCHGDAIGGHHTYTAQSNARTGVDNDSYRMLIADANNDGTADGSFISNRAPATNTYANPVRVSAQLNGFCADCHGGFHGQLAATDDQNNDAGAWIRHPTDVSPASAGYTFTGTATLPLGQDAGGTLVGADQEVMCVTCHAAHGTGQADMLRFAYDATNNLAGDGAVASPGCEECHGAK